MTIYSTVLGHRPESKHLCVCDWNWFKEEAYNYIALYVYKLNIPTFYLYL